MTIRLGKGPAVEPDPPVYLETLLACCGTNPGFMEAQRVAGVGPFATMLPGGLRWSALEDLLVTAADGGVAA